MASMTPDEKIRSFKARQAPTPGPLALLTKFSSTPENIGEIEKNNARIRYYLAYLQRRMLAEVAGKDEFKSLKRCGSRPIPAYSRKKNGERVKTKSPGYITVGDFSAVPADDGQERPGVRYGYKWLQHCASSHLCFVCAPKIRARRAEEIAAICRKMWALGYRWLFVTDTAPHYLDQEPEAQVKIFQRATRAAYSGRWWDDFIAEYGYVGQICGTEMTVPIRLAGSTGTHWHRHRIIFFDRDGEDFTPEEAAEIRAKLADRWVHCLQRVGLEARTGWDDVRRIGIGVELPRSGDQAADAAKYVSKGASCELSPGIFAKQGRAAGRVSHWEFIAIALITGDKAMQGRAVAIMRALAGRHWLHVSKGVQKIAGIKLQSEQDIMREQEPTPTVFEFDGEAEARGVVWWKINKYKMQREVLEAAERIMDFETVARMCCDGYHPETGEPLSAARKIESFATLERLRQAQPYGPEQ